MRGLGSLNDVSEWRGLSAAHTLRSGPNAGLTHLGMEYDIANWVHFSHLSKKYICRYAMKGILASHHVDVCFALP